MKYLSLLMVMFPLFAGSMPPQVVAHATHVCQSREALGHRCLVHDRFISCKEAHHKLKSRDCCHRTKYGGTSVQMINFKCSRWLTFPPRR